MRWFLIVFLLWPLCGRLAVVRVVAVRCAQRSLAVGETEISVRQNGKLLGTASVRREQVERVVEGAEFQWGYGMYGPLRAELQSKAVDR